VVECIEHGAIMPRRAQLGEESAGARRSSLDFDC
jgi:hypothetical protein